MKNLKQNRPLVVMASLCLVIVLALSGVGVASYVSEKNKGDRKFETFKTCNAVEKYIKENREEGYDYPILYRMLEDADSVAGDGAAPAPTASENSKDFSGTNVQVEGVDESDVVKTDGKYIYAIWQNKVYISEVKDDGSILELTSLDVPGTPFELFLNDNKLVIFSESNTTDYYYNYYNDGEVGIFVYDVSDKKTPEQTKSVKLLGNFNSARMIDNTIYFIGTDSISDYKEGEEIEEYITKAKVDDNDYVKVADCNEISYYGNNVSSLITIVALELDGSDPTYKSIMGDATNIYMSESNIYLSTVVTEYKDNDKTSETTGGSDIFSLNTSKTVIAPDYMPREIEDINTEIYKLSVDGTSVSFQTSGEVNGTILNQFSMDEYDGKLRIATTANDYNGWSSDSYNNMYILDEDLDLLGSVENLAEGEKIYSVRFMGPRAYMVTYKQVDPLFVLDLSETKNPKVLGELKIPGYSSYLHPYDGNHIIGVGMDTEELGSGSAVNKGIKIALFDVTDVTNPKVKSEVVLGGRGSNSPISYDHKAFLFDKDKNLLVIPAELYEPQNTDDPWAYGSKTFGGFLVLDISLEGGLKERGKISQDDNSGYVYDSKPRSFYIGDNLYTFRNGSIKASKLSDLSLIVEDKLR